MNPHNMVSPVKMRWILEKGTAWAFEKKRDIPWAFIRRLKDAAEKPVSISMRRKRKKPHTRIVRNNARRKIRQENVLKGYETLKKD